jgi:hypothetical protein
MDFEKLSIFRLRQGAHDSAEDGVCAMEAVAWLEGLQHSDHPPCTCPVIATFVRRINDEMPDDVRQRLVAYLPRLVGTVSPEHERERGEYLAWRAVTVFAPLALEVAGLGAWAHKLRSLKAGDWQAAASAAAGAYASAAAAYAWDSAFEALDGALSIGPQSPGFSGQAESRIDAYRELLRV